MALDPEAAAVLDMMMKSGAPPLGTLSVAEHRERMKESAALMSAEVAEVARVETFEIPGRDGDVRVRLYAHGPNAAPTLVFFHGGGWVLGSIESHDELARDLAIRSGWSVLSVDYRLSPEHPYPAPFEDCYAAVAWAASGAGAARGIDSKRLAVGGDSAGGNLAAAVALAARARGGPKLLHQLLIYPALDTDFETRSYKENAEGYMLTRSAMQWCWRHYLGGTTRVDHFAAPCRVEDVSDLPPATIITAEYDPLRDEGETYGRMIREAGGEAETKRVPGMFHGFLSIPMMTRALEAREYVAERLRAVG
jgi:acetyl esterase